MLLVGDCGSGATELYKPVAGLPRGVLRAYVATAEATASSCRPCSCSAAENGEPGAEAGKGEPFPPSKLLRSVPALPRTGLPANSWLSVGCDAASLWSGDLRGDDLLACTRCPAPPPQRPPLPLPT